MNGLPSTEFWRSSVKVCQNRLADEAIEAKRRRVASFMRALPQSWDNLEEGFRVKYSVKVRREMQRLLLLEHGTPIPPTRMLDSCAGDASVNAEVCERMHGLVRREARPDFIGSFFTYLSANWRVVENLPVEANIASSVMVRSI